MMPDQDDQERYERDKQRAEQEQPDDQREEKRRTVKVACTLVNGIELRLFDKPGDTPPGVVPGATVAGLVALPGSVILKGADARTAGVGSAASGAALINEVDGEFWDKWLEQNQDNPLVTSGAIAVVGDDVEQTDDQTDKGDPEPPKESGPAVA